MPTPRAVLATVVATLLTATPALAQMAPEAGVPIDTTSESPSVDPAASPTIAPAPAALPEDRPFAALVPNFFRDLRRLPSVSTAVVLGVGGAMAGVAYKNDRHFVEHASAGGTDQIFTVGGNFGGGYTQAGIAVGTYAIGRITKRKAVAHLGSDLIRAQVVTGVITHAVKAATRRSRPDEVGIRRGGTYSFPSAHSSATWASATVFWRHYGWKAGIPASLLASYASASRLQQKQHYMTDILVGAAIGVAVGRTVTMGHRQTRFVVAPAPVQGGMSLNLAYVPR